MKINIRQGQTPWVILICLILPWFFVETSIAAPALKAVDGVYNLTDWDPETEPLLQLEGQVRFHWQAFTASHPETSSQAELIRIPASWHKVSSYPVHGYATYAFDLVSDAERPVALDFGLITVSHRIYLNGKLIRSNGNPASSPELFQQSSANKVLFSFILPKGSTQVQVEVANYDYILGGLSKNIYFGKPEAVQSNRFYPMFTALILFGAYLVMGLYHFGLFSLRRRDRSALYFGLFCLASIPGILVNNEVNCLDLLGTISIPFSIFLAATLGLAMAFLGLFLAYIYDDRLPRLASFTLMGLYTLFALSSQFHMKALLVMLALMLGVGFMVCMIYVYSIIQALRAHKQGAGLMLVSICTVLLAAVHDYANFNGWIRSFPVSSMGSLAFLMIQSYLLSTRFSRAFRQVEISERRIRQVNENLEHLADEKTREVRSILTHIQLGIFSIEAENFQIHRDHSQHMQEIFEIPDIAGRNAFELLIGPSQLTSDEKSQAASALAASLDEDAVAFQLNAQCLPHEIQYQAPSGQPKLLELSWHPVVNALDCTEKILVTVRDVTKLRALEEEALDKKEELQFISELLNVPAESFRRFMQTADDFILENRELVNSKSVLFKDPEILKILFINMHTMKGAARSLYLKKMTKVFHDVEQYYAHLQSDPDASWDVRRMNVDLDEAEAMLRKYKEINQTKLGRKMSDERVLEIPESNLQELYVQLEQEGQAEALSNGKFFRTLRGFFMRQLFTPVHHLLTELCACTETLAKDLKKDKPQIVLDTGNLSVSGSGHTLFRKIFVHLLRNSMDHGIETAAERLQLKKPAQGSIRISAHRENDQVTLIYADDGRGLDLERIRSIALQQELIRSQEAPSPMDIGELIFYPGLSTANHVTDVSGRGVGMDAVRSFVQKAGGSITLHCGPASPNGYTPFHFQIRLPLQLFAVGANADTGLAA